MQTYQQRVREEQKKQVEAVRLRQQRVEDKRQQQKGRKQVRISMDSDSSSLDTVRHTPKKDNYHQRA